MRWMSNADLWSNLITGTFALGGALLGFLGSWFAAIRAAKVTREQIQADRVQTQQDRIHERRDEAISDSYEQILAIDDAYRKILARSRSGDKESKCKELDHLLLDIGGGWLSHFRKNQPWIPEIVANRMITIFSAYQDRARDFRESLDEVSDAKLPEVLADEYSGLETMQEAVAFEQLRFDIRAALGIEEPNIGHTLALLDRSHNPDIGTGRRGENEENAPDTSRNPQDGD